MDTATSQYTSFRVALASGILGAAGATFGWLAWLTSRVANRELLLTVAVGALLGVAVHWIQHYVRVAKQERSGELPHHVAPAHARTMRSTATLAWAAGFGLLGLVTEHLVAEMAAQFLQPLLASIATLLPAGMIIGGTMHYGRAKGENPYIALTYGILTGVAIALVTGALWTIGFGSAPWFALISWWSLIGVGMRLVLRSQRQSMRVYDPLIAVALIFVGTLLLDRLPMNRDSYAMFGPYRGAPVMLRMMAWTIHESPAVPATFWLAAEQRFADEKAGKVCEQLASVFTAPIVPVDTTPVAAPKPVSSDPLQRAIDAVAGPAPADTVSPREPLPQQPWLSDFARSWLVIVLFALGLGAAPRLERSLRPMDYPSSETYRRDVVLASVVLLMLVGACIYARADRRREAARAEACTMARLRAESSAPR